MSAEFLLRIGKQRHPHHRLHERRRDHLPGDQFDEEVRWQARPGDAVTLHSIPGNCILRAEYCTQIPDRVDGWVSRIRPESSRSVGKAEAKRR
jgi:hypothetical protein